MIAVDEMQLVHDRAVVRRTWPLNKRLDDASADLVGESEDEGSEEKQKDELHPPFLFLSVADLKFPIRTVRRPYSAEGFEEHHKDDGNVERNP